MRLAGRFRWLNEGDDRALEPSYAAGFIAAIDLKTNVVYTVDPDGGTGDIIDELLTAASRGDLP